MRPEGVGKFLRNPPHRELNTRPSGLQHSALTTTLPRAPNEEKSSVNLKHQTMQQNMSLQLPEKFKAHYLRNMTRS
jgi:hypothetical protein